MSDKDLEKIFEYFERIFKNADSLIKESKLLFENGYYRRSAFLSITAYEELMKIYLSIQNEGKDNKAKIYSHREKFPFFKIISERIDWKAIEEKLDHEKLKLELKEKYSTALVADSFKKLSSTFEATIMPSILRSRLLYEDAEPHIISKLIANENYMTTVAEAYLNTAIKTYSDYRELVSDFKQAIAIAEQD